MPTILPFTNWMIQDLEIPNAQVAITAPAQRNLLMIDGVPYLEIAGVRSSRNALHIICQEPAPANTRGVDRTPLTLATAQRGTEILASLLEPIGIAVSLSVKPRSSEG